MKITAAEVEGMAQLARLRLTAGEITELTQHLDDILEYMDKLNQVDTSHVAPFTHTQRAANTLREDAVTSRVDPEGLLAGAPDRDGSFFKVPKIIE